MNFAKIKIFDINGEKIFDDTSLHLPIKEEYVIKKSVELFRDPEPCVIHRSAVVYHIANEITKMLKEENNNTKILKWKDITPEIKEKLFFDKEPYTVIIKFI